MTAVTNDSAGGRYELVVSGLPWHVDGVWGLVAGGAWGLVTCFVTAVFVCDAIARRRVEPPATGWVAVSIAVGGYAGLALGSGFASQVICAVGLSAITLWLLAFDVTGRARVWRWSASRRARVLMATGALLVALSYSVTHAFLANGSVSSGNLQAAVRVGHAQTFGVGLSGMRLPITVQSVAFTGPGSFNARLNAAALNLSAALPRDGRFSTERPFRVPAGRSLWITVRVSLRKCQSATLDTLKLGYTVLGVRTNATISLSSPMTLTCSR
jgi:hypothetical protein